jgi:hypothetical protein
MINAIGPGKSAFLHRFVEITTKAQRFVPARVLSGPTPRW